MLIKLLQYLSQRKILIALTIVLLVLLLSNLLIFYGGQKKYFSQQGDKGKLILTDLNSNHLLIGKLTLNASEDNITTVEAKTGFKEAKPAKINDEVSQKFNKRLINTTLLNTPETNGDLIATRPKLALLIDRLGLVKADTLNAIETDAHITLSFSPYSQNIKDWIDQSIAKGHEVYMDLPMYSSNLVNDTGPLTLMNELNEKENLIRLNTIFSQSNKIKGMITSSKEDFTSDNESILPIFKALKRTGMTFIYGGENNKNLRDMAKTFNLDYSSINVVIDEEPDTDNIKNNLLRLENIAKVRGFAVGKFSAYPMSIKMVNEWVKNLNDSELLLVPVSQLIEAEKQLAKEKNAIGEGNENSNNPIQPLQDNEVYSRIEYEKYFDTSNKVVNIKEGESNLTNSKKSKETKVDKEEAK